MTSNVGFFNGRLGIAKSDPQVAVYINTSDAIKLPSGFTSQRPTGTTVEPGMMRYNSTTGKFEGFSGDTGMCGQATYNVSTGRLNYNINNIAFKEVL